MIYLVTHRTRYHGSEPVSVGQNLAWLKPRSTDWQTRLGFELEITPKPSNRDERKDYFGNTASLFSFDGGYNELTVTAASRVEVRKRPYPEPVQTANWEQVRSELQQTRGQSWHEAAQFAFDSPRSGGAQPLRDYAAVSFPPQMPILTGAIGLTQRIYREFKYRPQSTTVSTPVDEVFQERRGVCQDFAHVQIAMLRSLGLAARYVSGYLRTIPPPGKERLRGADASHAWLSVFCGDAGWVDLDPTNNCLAQTDHVTIAWGRDYGDVPPLKGIFIGGGAPQLKVEVDVEPLPPGSATMQRPS
ncbi:MAG: transglutaminase N-terminal domain-containing protein [Planctomycetaceae bacterium]